MDTIAWLRDQDPAFRAVVVGGVGLVAFVALVVGVTVVTTIGGMLHADGGQATSPETEFTVEADGDAVTITFERGDALQAGDVYVELDDGHEGHVHREVWADRTGLAHDEPIPPGSAVTVGSVQSGDVLRVVYRPGDGGQVLVKYVA